MPSRMLPSLPAYPIPSAAFLPSDSPPSVSESLLYARHLFRNFPDSNPVTLCGSIAGPDSTRDVLFDWGGYRYRLTCWREEDGSIYGEW